MPASLFRGKTPPKQRYHTVRKPVQMKTKKGMYKDFKCITHLYILSTGALDCLSSPKGVLETGRTTPSKKKRKKKVQSTLNF